MFSRKAALGWFVLVIRHGVNTRRSGKPSRWRSLPRETRSGRATAQGCGTHPGGSGERASPITDPELQEALDYWRCKASGKALPRRADIDPLDIPKLLPHLMLVEGSSVCRYRYRLIGTEAVLSGGIQLRTAIAEGHSGPDPAYPHRLWLRILAEPAGDDRDPGNKKYSEG